MGRRLRRAYAEAWAERTESNAADELLIARLRAHELDEVLDETAPIHHHILDLWRRGVPPEGLTRETWRVAGRTALHLLDTGRSVWRAFGSTSEEEEAAREQEVLRLEALPDGKRWVTDRYAEPASALLTFEPGDGAAPPLQRFAEVDAGVLGWHRPLVWLDMLPDEKRARVALGGSVVGGARVPEEIWRRMIRLADEGWYAGGSLEFRIRDEAIEYGTLLVRYAADPPGTTVPGSRYGA